MLSHTISSLLPVTEINSVPRLSEQLQRLPTASRSAHAGTYSSQLASSPLTSTPSSQNATGSGALEDKTSTEAERRARSTATSSPARNSSADALFVLHFAEEGTWGTLEVLPFAPGQGALLLLQMLLSLLESVPRFPHCFGRSNCNNVPSFKVSHFELLHGVLPPHDYPLLVQAVLQLCVSL